VVLVELWFRVPLNPLATTICVGLPTRNRPNLLRRALTSISLQTRAPDEVLIGDNSDNDETFDVYLEWREILPNLRYFRRERNVGPTSNFLKLLDDSVASHFMWLADDDVMEPNLLEAAYDFLEHYPGVKFLCWGFSVHNYVTGITEHPHSLPLISHDCGFYTNACLYLAQPISSLFYGLYDRHALMSSSLSIWHRNNVSFDWMDVACITSTLLYCRSHLIPERLVVFGIDQPARPIKCAGGLSMKRYDPLPWLWYGTILILTSSRLSFLERLKLLPKFLYAWRNTTSFAINHS